MNRLALILAAVFFSACATVQPVAPPAAPKSLACQNSPQVTPAGVLVVVSAVSFIGGVALACLFAPGCRRACCMSSERRENFMQRQAREKMDKSDAGLPPRHTHTGLCAHPKDEDCRPIPDGAS